MGQQQVLFVILAVCVIAIALSIGVIALKGTGVVDNRALVEQDLKLMARKVQEFVRTPSQNGGGRTSLSTLAQMPDALQFLGLSHSNAHGDFRVKRSDNPACIQIIGVGMEQGYDTKKPLRLMITVWADSTAISTLN
ncbi:MAG: hypothetical protein AAB393_06510 [Bacteroidota bacterium]